MKTRTPTTEHVLTLRVTAGVVRYLERLVATGLYGATVAEAAERLVARGIVELVVRGEVARA